MIGPPFHRIGGKRRLVPTLKGALPDGFRTYVEPFCLLPNEPVLVVQGGEHFWMPIEQLGAGDCVETAHGPRRVLQTMRREYEGEVVRLTVYGDYRTLTVTLDHPVLAIKRWASKRKQERRPLLPEWIPAGELRPGDLLVRHYSDAVNNIEAVPMPPRRFGGKVLSLPATVPIDDRTLDLLGAHMAEGYLDVRGGGFALNVREVSWAHRLATTLADYFKVETTYGVRPGTDTLAVRYSGVHVRRFLEQCGHRARGKHIPGWLMRLPPNQQAPLLRAIWTGDGYRGNGGVWTFATVSPQLADDMVLLCRRQGMMPSLRRGQRNTKLPSGNRHLCVYHTVALEQQNDRPWMGTLMGMPYYGLAGGLQKSGWNLAQTIDESAVALSVKSTERLPYKGLVHNLSVAEAEHYITPIATVHNCGSAALFFALAPCLQRLGVRVVLADADPVPIWTLRIIQSALWRSFAERPWRHDTAQWRSLRARFLANRNWPGPWDEVEDWLYTYHYVIFHSFLGKGDSPSLPHRSQRPPAFGDLLQRYHELMAGIETHVADYRQITWAARECEAPFAYLDPPYSATNSHNYYDFPEPHRSRIVPVTPDAVAAAVRRLDYPVLVSYDDTPAVRAAFAGFFITTIPARYSIRAASRTVYGKAEEGTGAHVEELLIANYPLVRQTSLLQEV